MSMHTELITVNKRDLENMVKQLRERDDELARLRDKIQRMKEAIALVIDQNL